MPNAQGTITKIWPNNGKPKIVLDNGMQASAFSPAQLSGAQEGQVVSFAYETKDVNGKQYTNIKGNLAIVGGNASPSAGASQPAQNHAVASSAAPSSLERNGMQVGAAINQAIAMLGPQAALEEVEATAKGLLLMGDRLSMYEVAYKKTLKQCTYT
jgi:hypothetical protein